VPSNLKFFLFEYKNSKFIECNQDLRDEIFKIKGKNYSYLNATKENNAISVLEYIAKSLESLYKNYWISSGTLLGIIDKYLNINLNLI
jgi:hypothetical protein